MLLETPKNWPDYELIDSGDFEKLERFGSYVVARPEPKALWHKTLPEKEWERMSHTKFIAGAGFGRSGKEESGTWKTAKEMPQQWVISYKQMKLRLSLTSFKHVGVFPEQAPNWDFIYRQTKKMVENAARTGARTPKVLNLFAYTGAASMAARAAGADTTHLDSVRQFVKREAKRGKLYNGLILDPPAYGHGPDGEKWKLDELLFDLLLECSKIVAPKNSFTLLNLYSNGYSALLADTAVREAFKTGNGDGQMEFGELVLKDRFGKAMPLSVFSRLTR